MDVLAQDTEALQKMRTDGWEFDPAAKPVRNEPYPMLYSDDYGPTDEVLEKAESPLEFFFFFMPRRSNRYYNQHLNERVDRMYEKKVAQDAEVTRDLVLLIETRQHKKIKAKDVLHCIGLLIARMICTVLLITGTNKVLVLCEKAPSVATCRRGVLGGSCKISTSQTAWTQKQKRIGRERSAQSWILYKNHLHAATTCRPCWLMTSRYNVTRQFMKDKPHKWGTKVIMTCCADTPYSLRHEVYCGTEQYADELDGTSPTELSAGPNSGPAAVMRNLGKVLPTPNAGVYYVVVTDRFYTSLLSRNVYSIGTIQANKKGFPPALITKDVSRPADVARGSAVVAVAKCCPQLQAILCTTTESCGRHIPGGERLSIPCPSGMRDYHHWMGGVDIHDQLRLQRVALQQSVCCRKFYKTVFLGLVGMAMKQRDEPAPDHAEFLQELQAQLLQVKSADLIDEVYTTCDISSMFYMLYICLTQTHADVSPLPEPSNPAEQRSGSSWSADRGN
ncbi:Hypothetical protein PHPALM_8603 [Phytophthora palmivora]|uniref:PiggyBac transposable element-derived protein domain-containing protein n=1 Tax=Phytophthora palmivora TaxID=4796 RepID=A0A2P4Y9F1_9STRA|nr:Hypothetical protein PHPALM_8603 [Phytophthora palmivora]